MTTQGIQPSENQIFRFDLAIEAGCTESIPALFDHRLQCVTCRVGKIAFVIGSCVSGLQLNLMINNTK